MKKLLLTALTISMLAFVGCSSDNDNDNPTPTNKIKLVSGIKVTEDVTNVNYQGDMDGEGKIIYDDQNRAIKILPESNTIDYIGNTITTIFGSSTNADTTYAEVNANGYITSITSHGAGTYTYIYDSNGYMTNYVEYIGNPNNGIYDITWKNGNIVKIHGDANAYNHNVYEYEYTNIENKMNLDLFKLYCGYEDFLTGLEPFGSLYGKQCKNLLSKVKVEGNVTREFQYTMTSDGYVSKMIIKDDRLGEVESVEYDFSYIEVDAK